MADRLSVPNPESEAEGLETRLVAYLDGELDPETSREVDTVLATDPEARQLLHQLEQSWSMLDLLEKGEVEQDFTCTTIEMVALAAEEELKEERRLLSWRRVAQWALAAAFVCGMGLIGFLTVAWTRSDPEQIIVEDLPVLQNLGPYEQVGNIRFLELLDEAKVFDENEPSAP